MGVAGWAGGAESSGFFAGDCSWGTERALQAAEQRNIPDVFKLKQTVQGKRLMDRLFRQGEWVEAGQSWQGLSTELRLAGWSKAWRVVALRRPLREEAPGEAEEANQRKRKNQHLTLDLPEVTHSGVR